MPQGFSNADNANAGNPWGFIDNVRRGFRLAFGYTKPLSPEPYNNTYTPSIGYLPTTISPNSGAGGTFFSQVAIAAPGMYQNTHTILVGMPPQFSGVINQPLAQQGE